TFCLIKLLFGFLTGLDRRGDENVACRASQFTVRQLPVSRTGIRWVGERQKEDKKIPVFPPMPPRGDRPIATRSLFSRILDHPIQELDVQHVIRGSMQIEGLAKNGLFG